MNFQGNEQAVIDGNGRVSFPASFRKLVPTEKEFYISPGLDNTLHLRREIDNEHWAEGLKQRLQEKEYQTKKYSEFCIKMMSNTRKVVLDEKQNRFLLPKDLKEFACIEKDVVFIGNGDVIIISNVEKAAPYILNKNDNFEGYEWMV
jgi:MraZ protein